MEHQTSTNSERKLLLFLHGLGGSSRSWGMFPELLRGDDDLGEFDLAHFQYPSSLYLRRPGVKLPRIQLLADGLHTEIENRYRDCGSIVLVCHSLGGLVARRYLADRVVELSSPRDGQPWTPVTKVVFFGVPHTGAGLAQLASRFAWWQPQLKQLCRNSDFLDDLNSTWDVLQIGGRFDVKYVVAGQDGIVGRDSAAAVEAKGDVAVLTDCDHQTCVKPTSRSDLSYEVLKNFVLSAAPVEVPPPASTLKRLKVVGFDLDGTLLRGLMFSWTMIWDHLEYSRDVPATGMRDFLTKRCSYAEWCAWAVEKFRMKGLTRSDLQALAEKIEITRNLRPALEKLKQAGFTICVISGGIDVFLYEKIPDADELFDHVFINELEFDSDEVISGVKATPYDFDGKARALERVAGELGCTLEETVFVGDGFNDAPASSQAGLSIAYPPLHYEQAAMARHQIEDDDLMLVVEAILDRP